MSVRKQRSAISGGGLLAALVLTCCGATPLAAAVQAEPVTAAPVAPSDNAMVNLVRLLVAQGVITRDKGEALIAQAEGEAATARAAAVPAPLQAADAAPPPPAGTIRVPYVPETVRAQIKEELKAEVLQQAKAEGWASPGLAVPGWVRDVTLSGDVRVRSQSNLFSKSNSDQIFDVAGINDNGPTDLLNDRIPFLNTRRDRYNLSRLRARLGVDAQVGSHVKVGLQLATGDDPSPVSSNTLLGGGLRKRDVWLELAYLRIDPTSWSRLWLGRFENPFRTTDLMFDPDLALDGIAAQANFGALVGDGVDLIVRGGAFPLDFGDANFPASVQDKTHVAQKYLFSAQVEAGAKFGGDIRANLAVAYHDYSNIRGRLSTPCAVFAGAVDCSTDDSRVFSLQRGNTLFGIRQFATDPSPPAGTLPAQPQLFGLSFDYNLLDVTGTVSAPIADDIRASFTGSYVRNLAFKRGEACRYGPQGSPLTNAPGATGLACTAVGAQPTGFVGGNEAYQAIVAIGYEKPKLRGEWQVFGGYRYLQSDAVLDAFTEDNFHLGGTNAKGYFVGGSFGIFDHLTLGGRWMSANEISGDPLAIDVLQIDLMAAF